MPGGLDLTRHPTERELELTTNGTNSASQNSPSNNGRPGGSGDQLGQQESTGHHSTTQHSTTQDSGKRLIKLAVAIALVLVVAVFVIVLLVTGRTDDDKPEQAHAAVAITSIG
jgi:hypothetical protein